jgi:hypothetical protein
VHVNPGSGPERDDTGLPPVDIEIPDDARELDRDVQAYRREQRAKRRQLRSMRIHGKLSRDSMVMPLLICCLIFALISGTLLTLFTATSIDQSSLPRSGAGSGAGSAKPTTPAGRSEANPATTAAPSVIAAAQVDVAGTARTVSSLRSAILLVLPVGGCQCSATISQLAGLAQAKRVRTYVVAASSDVPQSERLAQQVGQGVQTVTDTSGALDSTHYPHSGLIAILVSPAGDVSYAQQLGASSSLPALVGRV